MIRSLWAIVFACIIMSFAAAGANAAPAPKAGASTLASGELVTKVARRHHHHHSRRHHHRRHYHHRHRHRVCWHHRHSHRHCVWRWR
jgi:hypothetical protein